MIEDLARMLGLEEWPSDAEMSRLSQMLSREDKRILAFFALYELNASVAQGEDGSAVPWFEVSVPPAP